MKNQIFTIVFMLMLVALTGKVFAQSTPVAPYEGLIHTYVVDGLTPGDQYVFGINQDTDNFSHVAGAAGTYTITEGEVNSPATASGTSAALTVQWDTGSKDETFNVWIKIIDSDGCPTYRYLPVTPVESDIDPNAIYDVNYGVVAVMTGDLSTTVSEITTTDGGVDVEDCPKFVGHHWLSTYDGDNSATDGSSYVYFRIERSLVTPSEGGPAGNIQWVITPSSTFAGATWAYSTNNAIDFTNYGGALAETTIGTGSNFLYIRATVPNGTTANEIDLTIAGGNDVIFVNSTSIHDADAATLTVKPLPTVNDFGNSF